MSTKGPRGGVFVMYNCARLHTLFDSYERGVEKGESQSYFSRVLCFIRHYSLATLQMTNNSDQLQTNLIEEYPNFHCKVTGNTNARDIYKSSAEDDILSADLIGLPLLALIIFND